jgi:hypothetical protein
MPAWHVACLRLSGTGAHHVGWLKTKAYRTHVGPEFTCVQSYYTENDVKSFHCDTRNNVELYLFHIDTLIISVFSPPASNPTTHRLEHNWQYNHTVGFLKQQILPDDGL